MHRLVHILSWLGLTCCFLIGAAFSLKQLREPDLWWMLRTGEWIIANKSFIYQDVFSFTNSGNAWINVKWAYEVLIYLISTIGGPSFIPTLQLLVTCGNLWLLYKSYILFGGAIGEKRPERPDASILLVLLAALIAIEFRMTGRPEMTSHLLTVSFLYVLLRYRETGTRLVWLLVPLQVIWANFHEAFGIGVVIAVSFAFGMWLEQFFASRRVNPTRRLSILVLVVCSSILAIAINPYGPKLILHPLNIFGQLAQNKYTTELLSFTNPLYWKFEAYLNLVFLFLSLVSFALIGWLKKRSGKRLPVKMPGFSYLLVWLCFAYLGSSAYRNIPFFVLVATPVVAVGLRLSCDLLITPRLSVPAALRLHAFGLALILGSCMVLYSQIVSNSYYETLGKKDRYGLLINALYHPGGASRFLSMHGIKGNNFSDYLTSSYLLWHLRPEFKSYIDLRDLDVFETSMFDSILLCNFNPLIFEYIDRRYAFEYVLLYRPNFDNLHFYLAKGSAFELVYVDAVAALYVRKGSAHQSVIDRYGYRTRIEKVFETIPAAPASPASMFVSRLFHPRFQPSLTAPPERQLLGASEYFSAIKNYELAEKYAEMLLETEDFKDLAHLQLGTIYLEVAQTRKAFSEEANKFLDLAGDHYLRAEQYHPHFTSAIIGQAAVLLNKGQLSKAAEKLADAERSRSPGSRWDLQMASAYESIFRNQPGQADYLSKWIHYLKRAILAEPRNPSLKAKLSLAYCLGEQCADARRVYRKLNRQTQAGLADLVTDEGELNSCLQKCAD